MKISTNVKSLAGAVTAAMLFLTQGVGAATIYGDDMSGFYGPGLVNYVAAKGNFPAIVIDNPFGPQTDNALLAGLELPGYYPATKLKATTVKARDDGHLVLVFNPRRTANGDTTCAAPAKQSASGADGSPGTLRLQAAFCYDDEMVSEAIMEMPRPAGINDPAFDQAMAQLMEVLLPGENQYLIGGCVTPGTC